MCEQNINFIETMQYFIRYYLSQSSNCQQNAGFMLYDTSKQ